MNIKSIALFILFVFAPHISNATVGGPTTIYNPTFNPENSSVYYVQWNQNGKGCPPELIKIDLKNLTRSAVISCDIALDINTTDNQASEIEISGITSTFKALIPINLSTNNIDVVIEHVRDEKLPPEDWVIRNHFTALIYQDGTKISEIPLTGCTREQPFIIQGYAIPGLTKRMAILVSTKNDCFEGGYIGESFHIINNVDVTDRTPVNLIKNTDVLKASASTMTVYERNTNTCTDSDIPKKDSVEINVDIPANTSTYTPSPSSPLYSNQIATAIIAAVFLIIGVILGHAVKR